MLRKICPCLQWFASKQKSAGGKAYRPQQQLEQQQFMHQVQNQTKKVPIGQQTMDQSIPIEQQITQMLGEEGKTSESTPKQTSLAEEEISNEQEPPEESSAPAIAYNTGTEEKSYDFSNLGELQLNIPEYGPHYQLLKEKTHGVAELLDIGSCTQVSPSPGKSIQEAKLQIIKSRFRVWRTPTPLCFVLEYEIPCSYAYYSELTNKKLTPKDNNKIIREYKLIESIQQNLSVRYICFNKIGMLEPRDFTYLKYTNMSTTNPSGHWELCVSTEGESDSTGNVKKGKLFSVSYVIEEKNADAPGIRVRVRTYINIEIGVNVDKVWERILNETKGHIEKLWDEASEGYSEELV